MAMTLYFMTIPPLFSRVGDIQNIVVLAFKFIPLIFVPIMGIVIAATGNADKSIADLAKNLDSTPGKDAITAGKSILNFKGLGAFLGVFLSISAIFFAYDGFYVAAGIQSEMKEPKKTPAAMFLGMAATTLIYLIIAFAMSINGGSFFGMQDGMEKVFKHKRAAQIVFGIINICIAIGVTGILNGFSM